MSADELVERLVALCGTHPDAVAARMLAREIIAEIKKEIIAELKKES